MQPETTDRITEDTNVDEKKVVVRDNMALTVTATSGGYYSVYGSSRQKYILTGNNSYNFDLFVNYTYVDANSYTIQPGNSMILDISTGAVQQAIIYYISSAIDDIGGGRLGNVLDIVVTGNTVRPGFTGTNWSAYYLLYSTKVTDETIL